MARNALSAHSRRKEGMSLRSERELFTIKARESGPVYTERIWEWLTVSIWSVTGIVYGVKKDGNT